MSIKIARTIKYSLAFSTGMVFLCPPSGVAADRLSLGGYYKNYSLALDQPYIENAPAYLNVPVMGSVSNRLRLNVTGRVADGIRLHLAYDLSPRVQDNFLFGESFFETGISSPAYRGVDFDARLYPGKDDRVASFGIFHNLDRAALSISVSAADVYIGRQAIAWGSARVINPTDIITPFVFNELDIEDRRGVDAVRVRVPTGFMGELDAGLVCGEDFMMANGAWFVRGKTYLQRTDVSLITIGFRKNLLMGVDLARAIGGAGVWLEAAQVFVGALDSPSDKTGDDYFRASIGCDYSLRDGTYLFIEYHYNQAGAPEPNDFVDLFRDAAYSDGAVYLLGEHYVAPGVIYQVTPLITATAQALVNIADQSAFVMPQIEYNIAEDIYLSAGAYLGIGESPIDDSPPFFIPSIHMRSEFGSYPGLYFSSFRVYF